MSTKKATTTKIPKTLTQVEELVGEIAALDADIRKISAEMDKELATIRTRYANELDELKAVIDEDEALVASWAELNKEAFGKAKSLQLTHGAIGWRLGNPTLTLRPRVKLEAALEKVRSFNPDYISRKEALDKAALLAAYAGKAMDDETLARLGLRVTQTERFFVEPKREEVQA